MSVQRPSAASTVLPRLLTEAAAASPSERIDYRDRIAAHGPAAVEELRRWLGDARLGAFAVRTLEAMAKGDSRREAVGALTAGRSLAVSPTVRSDIEDALVRLGARAAQSQTPVKRDPYAVASIPERAGQSWPGFREIEFGRIAGTTWRSRDGATSLAPIVTRALRYQHPHFESYPIPRVPQIQFAIRERYTERGEHESGWRAAKLVVYAQGPTDEQPDLSKEVVAGLFVEKSDGGEQWGPLDERWDWLWFVQELATDHTQQELSQAMVRHDLRIGDYIGQNPTSCVECKVGFIGRFEGGRLVLREDAGGVVGEGWDDVQQRLQGLPSNTWHNLHIWRSWPAEHAVQRGQAFAFEELGPVLTDLARVYVDVVAEPLERLP